MLRFWILRPFGYDPKTGWYTGQGIPYDESVGFVVAATSEEEARRLAEEGSRGDENHHNQGSQKVIDPFWGDPDKTSCVELATGAFAVPAVLLCDFHYS